jgi:hypothetical protein
MHACLNTCPVEIPTPYVLSASDEALLAWTAPFTAIEELSEPLFECLFDAVAAVLPPSTTAQFEIYGPAPFMAGKRGKRTLQTRVRTKSICWSLWIDQPRLDLCRNVPKQLVKLLRKEAAWILAAADALDAIEDTRDIAAIREHLAASAKLHKAAA